MSFGKFMSKVGVDLEKVIGIGVKAAQVAEPVVDILFPAVATLFNSSVNEAVKLLAAGQAAAAQGGGATVELANVAAVVEPQLVTYMQTQGIIGSPTATQVNAFTGALLAALQTLVTIENGTAAPTVTVTTAAGSATAGGTASSTAAGSATAAPAPAPALAAA